MAQGIYSSPMNPFDLATQDIPPGFYCHFSETPSSLTENYRFLLRNKIIAHLEQEKIQTTAEECQNLLDLQKLPDLPKHRISLSHSKGASLFAWLNKPGLLGIDTEQQQRIRKPVLLRVSSPEEMAALPNWKMLWCAKEAAWKALNIAHDLKAISELSISCLLTENKTVSNQEIALSPLTSFKVSLNGQSVDGLGQCAEKGDNLAAFFYSPSTFV